MGQYAYAVYLIILHKQSHSGSSGWLCKAVFLHKNRLRLREAVMLYLSVLLLDSTLDLTARVTLRHVISLIMELLALAESHLHLHLRSLEI